MQNNRINLIRPNISDWLVFSIKKALELKRLAFGIDIDRLAFVASRRAFYNKYISR
jgi:hypothetical protein